MDSRTTQGTSRASMIIRATVVFPEALPPPRPAGVVEPCEAASHVGPTVGKGRTALSHQVANSPPGPTGDRGPQGNLGQRKHQPWHLMVGRSCLTHPTGGDGQMVALAADSPMAKASLDCVPCSLYQGGRPAV